MHTNEDFAICKTQAIYNVNNCAAHSGNFLKVDMICKSNSLVTEHASPMTNFAAIQQAHRGPCGVVRHMSLQPPFSMPQEPFG